MPKFCERKFIYLENIKATKIYLFIVLLETTQPPLERGPSPTN